MLIYDEAERVLILDDMENKICRIKPYAPDGFHHSNLLDTSYPESGYSFFLSENGEIVAVPKAAEILSRKGQNGL